MAINSADIKLLKSAVMADTTDGGGQLTGTVVVDGQSNNLFPDTSEMDRAFGRVNLRKVFGVVHTANNDSLLGAHAIVTKDAEDPMVHCTILQTSGWADTRDTAKTLIERYLVKGPKLNCRLMDTHYTGTQSLRLYMPQGTGEFPAGGDSIVLKLGNTEQYVRVLRTSTQSQTVNVASGSGTVTMNITVVTCELSTALKSDFTSPSVAPVVSEQTLLYTTVPAPGAKFYGVKKLRDPIVIGALSATVDGGIFTPLVPASTTETPIVGKLPLIDRQVLVQTSDFELEVSAFVNTVTAGTKMYAPSPVSPGTLRLSFNTNNVTDDGNGGLLQGSVSVGEIDYRTGTLTFSTTVAVTNGNHAMFYKPATLVGAMAYSEGYTITTANQGLSFVNNFTPAPAPESFVLSYMAQGRWYDLKSDQLGKLAGNDSSYGAGSINYSTGSMAVTLGALPDVGSKLVALWGDKAAASKITRPLPSRLQAKIALGLDVATTSMSISWSRSTSNYTATMNSSGVLTGSATGRLEDGVLYFSPDTIPDAPITINYRKGPSQSTAYTGSGLSITTSNTGIAPGSFKCQVLCSLPIEASSRPSSLWAYDDGNGGLVVTYAGARVTVGTINYSTGAVSVVNNVVTNAYRYSTGWTTSEWGSLVRTYAYASTQITFTGITGVSYAYGTTTTDSLSVNPVFGMQIDLGGLETLAVSGLVFKMGPGTGFLYTAQDGVLRQGWSTTAGTATQASVGTVSADGFIALTTMPASGFTGQNQISWYNASQDLSYKSVRNGIFRTESAPLKSGNFQLIAGTEVGSVNGSDVFTGDFTGSVDVLRGLVEWAHPDGVPAASLSYNAVFLQYLPLSEALLGLDTARLPLDGKVPVFRPSELVVVHNTQTTTISSPLTRDSAYSLGRVRVANVRIKDSGGVVIPEDRYTADMEAGTVLFPAAANLTAYVLPYTVEHRIEDMLLCSVADISGKLTFTRSFTHAFPANTSYVSSVLSIGDLFSRAYNSFEQASWGGSWSDTRSGSAPTGNYNEALYPIEVTNQGAITERWALVFTSTTSYRVIGEVSGEIGTGTTGADCSPTNPATGVPYFTVKSGGWGSGWAVGNAYRFNTQACGTPLWVCRTVLQGPATLLDDKFSMAFRGDVDRP